jgi:hypothetical protein
LVMAGARITAPDRRGWTPLQKARTVQLQTILKTPVSEEARRIFQEELASLRAPILTPAERMSKIYFDKGMLDFTERVEDGFYDAGRNAEFAPFAELERKPNVREVILADAERDPRLYEIRDKAREMLRALPDLEIRIRMLAMYVSNVMGGIQVDDVAESNEISKLSSAVLTHIKQTLGSNVVPLGCVTHGLCRHRALLYKYLCDYADIPCRLIRGAYENSSHAWNVVLLGRKHYLVDVMHDPMALYAEESEEAQNYRRTARVGGRHTAIGGIGGSSLRLPKHLISAHNRHVPLRDFRRAEVVLFEKLGSGSFGSVYRCSLDGFTCAVKIMNLPAPAPGSVGVVDEDMHYIKQEISLLEGLKHDNIVTYLGHDVIEHFSASDHHFDNNIHINNNNQNQKNNYRHDNNNNDNFINHVNINSFDNLSMNSGRTIHIFMEYFPISLSGLIKHQREKVKKRMSAQHIKFYALEVAKGIHYLHSLQPPILHRDIKSSNVLVALDEHGNPKKVKLCDFGVSKMLAGTLVARTIVGTPGWIAPEVEKSNQNGYTEKADVWSYGMFLFELLTLERPKPMMSGSGGGGRLSVPTDLEPSLQAVAELMHSCTRSDPRDRPLTQAIVFALSTMI